MIQQQTIGAAFSLAGVGLHTGARCLVTVKPAPAGYGRRIVAASEPRLACAMIAANRVPSVMSTSIALGAGRAIRTVEHLMASLAAFAIDNVLVEIDGPEIPIFDGSARRWCRRLMRVGTVLQAAERSVIRILKPVQVWQQGGFLRAEPAAAPEVDVTYDLLPGFPVMRWAGPIDRDTFLAHLARARSFGSFDWRAALRRPPAQTARPRRTSTVRPHLIDQSLVVANMTDTRSTELDPPAAVGTPVLQGARFGRATLVVGRHILPYARYRDEPLRHVVLDMIGDLALAGAPLLGRIVAHNPSHEKTYRLVATLLREKSAWTYTACSAAAETAAIGSLSRPPR